MKPEPNFSPPTPPEAEDSPIPTELSPRGTAPSDLSPSDKAPSELSRSEAARQMGRSRSEHKGDAARANGKKGGRPRGSANTPATRERMKASQKRRRAEEGAASPLFPSPTE